MKKQVKAIMLPTDRATSLWDCGSDICYDDKAILKSVDSIRVPQHIYIISDEEIKVGDHVLSTAQDYNMQVVPNHSVKTYNDIEHYFKIIATSDDNIRHCKQCGGKQELNMDGVMQFTHINKCVSFSEPLLPNVSQSFLETFVESGGKEDWEVEYEEIIKCYKCGKLEEDCIDTSSNCLGYFEGVDKLKLDSENCVILSAVEEKVYSKKELYPKIFSAMSDCLDGYHPHEDLAPFVENWIKENL